MPSKHIPDLALLQRHHAAMLIIREIDPDDRVLLLAHVVAPSEAVLGAQEEAKAA